MKINKIYLRNINSFKGEHSIDFTANPLGSAGLFAIVGPTGAGKSTLLDAITLALFNRIPRFDKKISKDFIASAGSILTKGERECAVEVEFSCKSGVFTSKWWIELNKNNNFNDYGMEIIDLRTQAILPLKKSEVPDKNQELIGLSYDQFIKSILLSQGEFARFLKSGRDERGKLLEDITGTQIYRKLGKKAFEVAKEKGLELRDVRALIDAEKRKLASPEQEQDWLNKKIEIAQELEKIASEITLLEQKIAQKNKIFELEKLIKEKQQRLEQAQVALLEFEKNEAVQLQNHEKAEPFQALILGLQNQENELKNLNQRLQEEEKRFADNSKVLNQIQLRIAGLTKEPNLTLENALISLQQLRENLSQLYNKKAAQEAEKKAFEAQITELLTKIADRNLQFSVSQISDENIQQIKNVGISHKNILDETLKQANITDASEAAVKREVLAFEFRNYAQLKNCVVQFVNVNRAIEKERTQEKTQTELIVQQRPILEKTQKRLVELEQIIKQFETEKERLGKSYNFERDRQNLLKKDEPCPLCGSLEHPFLSHYANNYVEVDQKLTEAKKEEKELNEQFKLLNGQIVSAEALSKSAVQNLKEFEVQKKAVLTEIDSIKTALKIDKVGNSDSIDGQLKNIESQQSALQSVESKVEKYKDLQLLYKRCSEAKGLQLAYNQLIGQIKELYAGQDFEKEFNDIQTNYLQTQTAIQTSVKVINDLKNEIAPKNKAYENEFSSLESKIKLAGFENTLACQAAILSAEMQRVLREKKQNLLVASQTLMGQLKEHELEIENLRKSDDATTSLAFMLETQLEIKKRQTTLLEEQTRHEVTLTLLQNTKQEIQRLEIQLATLEKDNLKWELLDKYIGDATGKKFGTFAQGLTLARLIALANRRLKDLSDRYLLDKPSEQDEDELMIVDQYMGNERRSVKTLSGGETFMISLSLALALSDLASKNIKLDSLFIDEGFGTLDPESLDLALNTLEKLQQESQKNIGIISHVESIKERISTQIRLERNNRGFSRVIIQ
ncbi:SMC domain protein [Emticicia oligotrophica DSM 17448]|uniref:SMC domain protein n=1 Tax=Emticicia oligotrophica (strain DSM 17448 / CIP 109782 / MTCC 6937 / GPTSA100-15) TaxID=929562 RepID=A0ABM5N389_EMTOG|nr:AAA family ATPase [Emticicia oligotrophica]AFK03803.1 SMC domain protein [Emticicia oligotrophica DSM 17448]